MVAFLSFALTIGITQYSFGVFVTELEGEFGWTRSEVSVALSFFALSGAAALPVGWALDRVG
ncbi:MAG: MFS transporter, partial [Dehalococcoidia bacterium]|nr:MFS transporter [Dehalococcoidia bacterium]